MISKSHPPDVVVLDGARLLYARFTPDKGSLRLENAKSYAIPAEAFAPGAITPLLEAAQHLSPVLRRLRAEQGKIERVSILLPDSWFRLAILEVETLPEKKAEAEELVRWTMRRSLPIRPEEFRIAWHPVSRNGSVKLLVVAAAEKSLAALEASFIAEGMEAIVIEPMGLNLWNSVASREQEAPEERLFMYVRSRDFTTALFRGTAPVFLRSRSLSDERPLAQEIKLSASYLRNTLGAANIGRCYVAGNEMTDLLAETIAGEFSAPVTRISLSDYAQLPGTLDVTAIEAELTACTGVFTI